MFRIRQILDCTSRGNAAALAQVNAILTEQFSAVADTEIEKLSKSLANPFDRQLRSIVLVAEKDNDKVLGFASLLHAPDCRLLYLDYIAARKRTKGGGVGGALYERVRELALSLEVPGVFFECLPDDPALSPEPVVRKENQARLRFYERYGARPIVGTAYETPLTEGDDNPPYLVFDPLDRPVTLGGDEARHTVRTILERKYGYLCPKDYVEMVVTSFRDEPLRLREPRYVKQRAAQAAVSTEQQPPMALFVNSLHDSHHVRERGYVESPVRISAILRELDKTRLFRPLTSRSFPERYITAVHDKDYVSYLKHACALIPEGKSVYPYVFPIRNHTRPPKELPLRAGYYCIDTFTPLNRNAYLAARGAVDCCLTAAHHILDGRRADYALVRPPGHHAERRNFGGFCYFGSGAIAANLLSHYGKVAVLDIDYHHGNGTQDIFYQRSDVLTVSLHGHPRTTYPYFSGFENEVGEGEGHGYNLNLALPEGLDGPGYHLHLQRALRRVRRFAPRFLVVALGLDTAKGDPTGSFVLGADDFRKNGELIGSLALPTLVIQEGGYKTASLGMNARHFFEGLWSRLGKSSERSARGELG